MSSLRKLLKNILFSLFLLVFFFVVLEALSRILLDFEIPTEKAEIEYEVDPEIVWYNKPDQCVVLASQGIEYRINSKGLRCADFPLKKPEGETRLLIIGDSVTLGYGVTEDQAYPQMLQKYLCERLPDASFRVINGGVNAYSTREELMFLRKRGIGFEPDMVIVGFVLNDVSLDARNHPREIFGRLQSEESAEFRLRDLHKLLQSSHLVMSLQWVLKRTIGRVSVQRNEPPFQGRLRYMELLSSDKEEIEAGWDIAMSELEEMLALLRTCGIKMVVVAFPPKLQIEEHPAPDRLQKRLKTFCEDHQVPFVDLLPSFLENRDSHLFLDKVHLTASGYSLAAENIGESLITHGLLRDD